MISIRKFIYAGLLALASLSFTPTPTAAQESRGQFTLAHSVLWGKAIVPAGTYAFNFKAEGPTGMLTLTGLDSPHAGFMFLSDTEENRHSDTSQLVLHHAAAGSYVGEMMLGTNGVTLHFTPPKEKLIASNGSLASGR